MLLEEALGFGLGRPPLPGVCSAERSGRRIKNGVRGGPRNGNTGVIAFGMFSFHTFRALLAIPHTAPNLQGLAVQAEGGRKGGCRWQPEGGLTGLGGEGARTVREAVLVPPEVWMG